MIVFTDISMIPYVKDRGWHMFNLLCPAMIGDRVDSLYPPKEIKDRASFDSNLFEQFYTGWILNDQNAFITFMEIIMGDYYSSNAVVFTDFRYDVIDSIVDCLIKFIRSRYGLKAIIAYDVEDIGKCTDTCMSPAGLQAFMQDKEWYTQRTANIEALKSSLDMVEDMNNGSV